MPCNSKEGKTFSPLNLYSDVELSVNQRFRSHPRNKSKAKKADKKRVAIEPLIGHLLKTDYRLGRNFFYEIAGDHINIMFAATAFNFKRVINK